MIEILAEKRPNNYLVPMNEQEGAKLDEYKQGQPIKIRIVTVKPRSYMFHKKLFSLFNFAFEHWEPVEVIDKKLARYGVIPEKNFDQFRKDLTILAGYYDAYTRIDGTPRLEAKSLKFDKMSNDEFGKLYGKVCSIVLQKILINYSADDLESVIQQVLDYG
jgi:hypothetical protein